ncbi:zinc finger dihydrouridine synthase [Hysterangium stoloniferum]|nr:zinc finger dihydrouridine synthase [Hysterangium stoloniferum]
MSTAAFLNAGIAPVKPEFIISTKAPTPDDDAAEDTTNPVDEQLAHDIEADRDDGEPPAKRQKLSGAQRKKMAKEDKKKARGANKARKFGKVTEEVELCHKLASGFQCDFGAKCRYTHGIKAYLSTKSKDIKLPSRDILSNEPPFILSQNNAEVDPDFSSIDFTTVCPVFAETGACRAGFKCRFLGGHVRKVLEGPGVELVTNPQRQEGLRSTTVELNYLGPGTSKQVRTKQYPTPVADEYLKFLQEQKPPVKKDASLAETLGDDDNKVTSTMTFDEAQTDTPDVPLRPIEKKRLNWRGKTYLAPLTTVGNLPFRRLCTTFGADITCGEMGLATSFLSASREEWSLVRRHPSEKTFGIQLAGNKPATLVPTAEIMAKEFAGNLDFVDLNCGCPIDLIFKNGAGSALLDQPGKLGKILIGMNRALGDIPLTLKVRTGVKDGRNTTHRLMHRVGREWGASAITIHGRTRQQRYTKLADWDYIKQCVENLRQSVEDDDLPPIPIFGGGDCYSSESYWDAVESTGVDGVMVARGALIKPWIFTEIKERREWDISSRERLNIIRQYAEYGLNHFGSDTAGVNTTRRYLCEALSFQYRYIPIGLLERLPGRLNDRPPTFRGRDELETMLASGNSQTWVKLSEMFLGPAPERFTFTPKHRSNAHGSEEAQG